MLNYTKRTESKSCGISSYQVFFFKVYFVLQLFYMTFIKENKLIVHVNNITDQHVGNYFCNFATQGSTVQYSTAFQEINSTVQKVFLCVNYTTKFLNCQI